MRLRLALAAALVVVAGWLAAACRSSPPVRVFAAASLGDALRDVAAGLEGRGVRAELNLAGSQVLGTQIEQGAQADVYAFADIEEGRALAARGLVQPPRVFARNVLCAVTPAAGPRVRSLADLGAPGVKVVLAAPTVPAGRYAARALERMEPALGTGYRARVLANVVSQETNVRLVLAKVALGEADAGLVYASDAVGQPRVRAIPIPEEMGVVAEYGIGLVRADAPRGARAFVEAVLGPEGRRILAARGFRLP